MTKSLAAVLVLAVQAVPDMTAHAAPPVARRVCTPAADPNVWLAKTGGYWQAGGKIGHYRVVVRRRVLDHALDTAELQVLTVNEKSGAMEIASCSDMESPGLAGYVEDVRFNKVDDRVTAISLDISMKAMNDSVLRELYLASYRGKLKRIVAAQSIDIVDAAQALAGK